MTSQLPLVYCVWQLWTISFPNIAENPITDVTCPLYYRENLSNLGSYEPASVDWALFFMIGMSINVQLPWNTRFLNKISFSKNYNKLNSMVISCFSVVFFWSHVVKQYHPLPSSITCNGVVLWISGWYWFLSN